MIGKEHLWRNYHNPNKPESPICKTLLITEELFNEVNIQTIRTCLEKHIKEVIKYEDHIHIKPIRPGNFDVQVGDRINLSIDEIGWVKLSYTPVGMKDISIICGSFAREELDQC